MIHQFVIYRKRIRKSNSAQIYRMYAKQMDKYDVRVEDYQQLLYQKCDADDTAGKIRRELEKNPPKELPDGIKVGDVLVINHDGVTISYYIDINGVRVIPGFIRNKGEGAVIDIETSNYEIKGKKGVWEACDQLLIDGEYFYLMESMTYHNDAAFAILDAYGKLIVSENLKGFDIETIAEIRKSMYERRRMIEESQQAGQMTVAKDNEEPMKDQKDQAIEQNPESAKDQRQQLMKAYMEKLLPGNSMLVYQKYHENGMYERATESSTEQNYNMIDGNVNNLEVDVTSGQNVQEREAELSSGQNVQRPQVNLTSGQNVQKRQVDMKSKEKNVKAALTVPASMALGKKVSVILRLRQKQNEVAKKYGRPEPYQNLSQLQEMELKR